MTKKGRGRRLVCIAQLFDSTDHVVEGAFTDLQNDTLSRTETRSYSQRLHRQLELSESC